MKLTYVALLGSLLAFTACDNGAQDDFGSGVDDPRIETTPTAPNPNQTQSGSASSTSPSSSSGSQTGQPVNPSNLPPVPPRDENINVTVPPEQPRN